MLRYLYHWRQLPFWQPPSRFIPSTFISVVIPVRNEASSIEDCVASVLAQKYPAELFELIVVNDHSTDETPELLAKIKDPRLKVLHLADFVDARQTSSFKKMAIQTAIEKAKGTLIATTDGDCIVPKQWLLQIASLYEKKQVKFIAAPVNFFWEKSLLEHFQSLDFVGMMGITGAGIQGRFMHMCNGANLAYDKAAFFEVDGFKGIDHLASGDDMLLMQKIARQFPGSIAYLKNKNATVYTLAQATLNGFVQQRIRWASKSSDYKEWQVTLMLGIVWLFCVNIFASGVAIFFLGKSGLYLLLGQVVFKIIFDFLLLNEMTGFFERRALMRYFVPAQLMHIAYISVVGTLSIFIKKYKWKGRTTS